jgi:hypothetical protein
MFSAAIDFKNFLKILSAIQRIVCERFTDGNLSSIPEFYMTPLVQASQDFEFLQNIILSLFVPRGGQDIHEC